MKPVNLLSLNDIADKYDALFTDMYGVIWDGVHFYDGVCELFVSLRERGKKIYVLSNATTVRSLMEEKAAAKGFIKGTHYDGFITSGDVLAEKLKKHFFRNIAGRKDYRFYIIGRNNPLLFFNEMDHQTYDLNTADFVYVGSLIIGGVLPFDLTRFEPALRTALSRGLPLVCANPDLQAFHEQDKHLTSGAAAKWYANHGGKVYWVGKPYPEIFQYALEKTKMTADRSVMIGDTLRTDIAGAESVHMDSVLIYGRGMTADDLRTKTLDECYMIEHTRPTYLLEFIK